MEKFGIAHLSQIAMRGEAAHRSEMVSQLLFGEAYEVLEVENNWIKIRTADCNYDGWIDKKLWNPISEELMCDYCNTEKYFVKDLLLFIKERSTGFTFPIFAGSSFPYPIDGEFALGNRKYNLLVPENKQIENNTQLTDTQYTAINVATLFLNAPYLWGGRTPAGIDCSGFVQTVFKSVGLQLPRDASQQVEWGKVVEFAFETQPCDVAFFSNEEGKIIHVGLILQPGEIIHASGNVRIDAIDGTGIFNRELGIYTHNLRIIKRLL